MFKQQGHDVHALVGVSAAIWPGETLGLVGESGSGKTTLARALLGLVEPTSGAVALDGRELGGTLGEAHGPTTCARCRSCSRTRTRRSTGAIQVRRILRRSLKKLAGITGAAAETRMLELMRSVRLAERYVSARPSQLSGGLKQRLAIARAFAGDPQLVVCDEPTSALDVSVQAAILNLLVELQARERVSYLFISHDLGVVRYVSDRIAVLYLGRLMELGPAEVVFAGPHHPYTEALLSAVPTIDGSERERIRLEGDIPSAADRPPAVCSTPAARGSSAPICDEVEPPLVEVEAGHLMRCHIPIEELRALQAEATPSADERR